MLNTEVVQVSAGRTQKAGVTKSGRLIMWEVSNGGRGTGSCGKVFILVLACGPCCTEAQELVGFSPPGSPDGCCRRPFSARSH